MTSENLGQALFRWQRALTLAGVDAPGLSVRLLAEAALGCPRAELLCDRDRVLTPEESARLDALCARRAAGEPVAYILGSKEFYGLDLAVSPAVLVPRPETEHLIEAARERFAEDAPLRFADLGTGSGCLAVALATVLPRARGLAVDLSPTALEVARANLARHSLAERVLCVRADFAKLPVAPASLDLVLANPPYVSEAEYAALDPGVRDFEPASALVCGPAGTEALGRLGGEVRQALVPGGWLLAEIGSCQGAASVQIAREAGLVDVAILQDLAGLDRVLSARKP